MERWIKAHQDRVWKGRNVLALERGWDSKSAQKTKMELASSLIVGNSVMDIGCGTGDLRRYLKGFDYLGVDQSEDMLDRAKKRNPNARFAKRNLYDMDDLPKTDTVICLDVLHHQPDLEPGFSILKSHARRCLIITLWINGRDGTYPRQFRGNRGEIITFYREEELNQRFSSLNYEVHRRVGFPWKDMFRFFLG